MIGRKQKSLIKRTNLIKQTQDDVLAALAGSMHLVRFFSVYLTACSILLAVFIPHDGFFPTSQSAGMTNFHRWMYDQYVICSCVIGFLFYVQLKRKIASPAFRRKLNAYIKAYAHYNVALSQTMQAQEGELPWQQRMAQLLTAKILDHQLVQYLSFVLVICGPIAMYIWMTPFASTYKSSFWILAWWPVNALIILWFYSIQPMLLLRLFANQEIYRRYQYLQRKAAREQELQ